MLTDKHCLEFDKKGYTILFNALDQNETETFHNEADELANYLMSEGYDLVQDLGCIVEPLTCGYLDKPKTDDYKTNKLEYSQHRDSILSGTSISDIILNKYATWASKLLQSDDIFLLNEQYIVKPPRTRSDFAWHKDSDYYHDVRARVQPSIACWTALDDVDGLNGTLILQDDTLVEMASGSIVFMSKERLCLNSLQFLLWIWIDHIYH
ncbi:hypothetical protein CU098_013130 [Rhizopus stolonifer]|uniref:Phytanoyl-CoA dioxygenase n=1 Tax=Rhizopus stolonifer TaxID=4846 RepID=A0A367KUB7_RHIST|nr:hypothetical protein CU098_013130 [Rhizopus stolonifer]